jgi:predicted phosphodiesterase
VHRPYSSKVLIGVLSDPHANLPALDTVLGDVDRVKPDVLVCLGDFVGYGAQPNEVVAALKDRCDVSLVGNHDLAALGRVDIADFNANAAASAHWTSGQLSEESTAFLESLSPRGATAGLELAHASMRDPTWEYVLDSATAAANFSELPFKIGLVGHTHVPAIFTMQDDVVRGLRVIAPPGSEASRVFDEFDPEKLRLLINPGGVGQPRDGDPRASWLTIDDETSILTFRRLDYPVEAAQKAIRAAGLPGALADRLAEGW